MSWSTATIVNGREAARRDARRRSAARRRRWILAALGLAVTAIFVVPLVRMAFNELTLPLAHQDIIRREASAKHLDPALVAGVIFAETKFDPRPSPAGAQGLMQILPRTAQFLAHRSGATTFTTADLSTPAVNIAYGSYYLRFLLDQYGNSIVLALAAYNGGEANVDRWLGEARADRRRFTIADIPFPETQAYVRRVLQAERDYRTTYAAQLGYR